MIKCKKAKSINEDISLEEMLDYVLENIKVNLDENELDEDDVNEMDELTEDELFEDESSRKDTMTDEELKVESLKIATNIAKLMSDVTTDDIISIADKVSGFIRNHEIGSEKSSSDKKDEENEDDSLIDFSSLEDEEK